MNDEVLWDLVKKAGTGEGRAQFALEPDQVQALVTQIRDFNAADAAGHRFDRYELLRIEAVEFLLDQRRRHSGDR